MRSMAMGMSVAISFGALVSVLVFFALPPFPMDNIELFVTTIVALSSGVLAAAIAWAFFVLLLIIQSA